jgi:hypothetical protein
MKKTSSCDSRCTSLPMRSVPKRLKDVPNQQLSRYPG